MSVITTINDNENNESEEERGLLQHVEEVVKYFEGLVQYLQRLLRRADHTFMAVVNYPCSGIIATILICMVLLVVYEAVPYDVHTRYQYIEYKQADLPERSAFRVTRDVLSKKCKKQCNENIFCKMIVYDKKSYTCKQYDQDAHQLELVPAVNFASSIFFRMEKEKDGFLEVDGYVYWRTLTPMTYRQADTHCKAWGSGGLVIDEYLRYTSMNTFYLARTRTYNNITITVARDYIRGIMEKQKDEESDNIGFFVVDGITSAEEDDLRDKLRNDSLHFTYAIGAENTEILKMGGRVVYVTADGIHEVKSENYTKGYPLCQGRPFNQEKIVIY